MLHIGKGKYENTSPNNDLGMEEQTKPEIVMDQPKFKGKSESMS